MEIPKNILRAKALEQLNGKIELESATWAGRWAEKVEAEKLIEGKQIFAQQIVNFEYATTILKGKNEKQFMVSYNKLLPEVQTDYEIVLAFKNAENRINNAQVHMDTALARVNACTEVKEIIEKLK